MDHIQTYSYNWECNQGKDLVEDLALVEDLPVELLVDLLARAVLVERCLTSYSKVSSNSSGMVRISCPDRKEYFLAELVTFCI